MFDKVTLGNPYRVIYCIDGSMDIKVDVLVQGIDKGVEGILLESDKKVFIPMFMVKSLTPLTKWLKLINDGVYKYTDTYHFFPNLCQSESTRELKCNSIYAVTVQPEGIRGLQLTETFHNAKLVTIEDGCSVFFIEDNLYKIPNSHILKIELEEKNEGIKCETPKYNSNSFGKKEQMYLQSLMEQVKIFCNENFTSGLISSIEVRPTTTTIDLEVIVKADYDNFVTFSSLFPPEEYVKVYTMGLNKSSALDSVCEFFREADNVVGLVANFNDSGICFSALPIFPVSFKTLLK